MVSGSGPRAAGDRDLRQPARRHALDRVGHRGDMFRRGAAAAADDEEAGLRPLPDRAISAASRSYSPKAFGKPAFGCAVT